MDQLLPNVPGYQTNNTFRVSPNDTAATLSLVLPRPPRSAAMAAASVGFSTLDALRTLATSIPEWNQSLDDLNGQIADRQHELARLEERDAPPKSLRNKGSTESLRPKDGNENPFHSDEDDHIPPQAPINKPNTPRQSDSFDSSRRVFAGPTSPSAMRPKTKPSQEFQLQTPSPKTYSSPRPYPSNTFPRSAGTPHSQSASRALPAVLRKRKTESMASGESGVHKYRTRSMIIVYYDSAVQTAFEELVKFISTSRNAMRKGKMAAKMAEIQRAAESEADGEAEGDDMEGLDTAAFRSLRGPLQAARARVNAHAQDPSMPSSNGLPVGGADQLTQFPNATMDLAPDPSADADMPMPKLRFVSTRKMGPTRDNITSLPGSGPVPGHRLGGMLQGLRRGGGDDTPDVFDELDAGLEYCQVQCEKAAHQFLRDGECAIEIENIKARLREVKAKAEKEVELLQKNEAESMKAAINGKKAPQNGTRHGPAPVGNGVSHEVESISVGGEKDDILRQLEVDDTEVDGDEEIEMPKLVWKKARDMVP